MKRLYIARVLLVLAVLFGFGQVAAGRTVQLTSSLDWYTQEVDQFDQNRSISNNSLQLDSKGLPHIAYAARNHIYYGWHDGAHWHVETVDELGGTPPVLALDGVDEPHMIYSRNRSLKYAQRAGSAWDIQTIEGSSGGYSLAVDANAQPHISYSTNYEQDGGCAYMVKYAVWTESTWNIQIVEQGFTPHTNAGAGGATSLTLDSSGRPHLSYALNYLPTPCNHCLKYAYWTGSAWNIQTVEQDTSDPTPVTIGDLDLALDTTNSPHIAYVQTRGSAGGYKFKLVYAHRTNGIWEVQSHSEWVFYVVSLALDTSNRPHMAYPSAGNTRYTYWTGSTWETEVLDERDTRTVSLVLAPDSSAQILYHIKGTSDYSGTLKYAQQLPALTLTKDAIPQHNIGIGDTLTYTLAVSGPVGHSVRLWDPLPGAVEYVPGSVTPSASYSPTVRAIVWQGTIPTNTVQTISFQVALTGTNDVSPSLPMIINTAWLTDTEYSKGVSAMTIVNGWYSLLPLMFR